MRRTVQGKLANLSTLAWASLCQRSVLGARGRRKNTKTVPCGGVCLAQPPAASPSQVSAPPARYRSLPATVDPGRPYTCLPGLPERGRCPWVVLPRESKPKESGSKVFTPPDYKVYSLNYINKHRRKVEKKYTKITSDFAGSVY